MTHAQIAPAAYPVLCEPTATPHRPVVRGKSFRVGDATFYVRGVTYGPFMPDAQGREYWDLGRIDADFAQMAAHGINSVRIIHTVPPVELLDLANSYGLKVMAGLSFEQYIGYLIERREAPDIEKVIRDKVRSIAGHPAILCYALGNEIPAPMVRWLGARRVERRLERLYHVVKQEDSDSIVTYVNYPSTEYLNLPFLDVVAFNVYLEQQDRLEAYLARLQNIAQDRPLLLSEVGLDTVRHGANRQADVLDWQVRTAFSAGAAGIYIFSWTDEWYAGRPILDWDFGLTDRARRPKPALRRVEKAFAEVPFPSEGPWPSISVVICTYNGSRTISEALDALGAVDYPDFEVIVVDDGSSDQTAAAAQRPGVRLIRTENRGLSNARNIGLRAATGEIIAYLDDDAYPDPHWLTYLAKSFLTSEQVAFGGPNIPPPDDGLVADCVAHAPGGPAHVLLTDQIAEHIPGCNMAFRRHALEAIGGFDAQFRSAGDDVDICWRLQQQGWTIGFCPAAVVWHHRRASVRAYWKQQAGYGQAEALLERKWPQKYNAAGHVSWAGRLYAQNANRGWGWRRGRIYHGSWGSAPFQSLYQPAAGPLASLTMMPEWYLIVAALASITALGVLWKPLLAVAAPLLLLAILAPVTQAVRSAAQARFNQKQSTGAEWRSRALTAFLHLMQPLARLWGRLRAGLTPLRFRRASVLSFPRPKTISLWCEDEVTPEQRLARLERELRRAGALVRRGGDFDRWDLEVSGGILGSSYLLMMTEQYGSTQFVRLRCWPRFTRLAFAVIGIFSMLSIGARLDGAAAASLVLSLLTLLAVSRAWQECAVGLNVLTESIHQGKTPKGLDGTA